MTGPIGGNGSFRAGSVEGGAPRSLGGPGSVHNIGSMGGPGSIGGGGEGSIGPASPLMGSGAAGIGAGGGGGAPALSPATTGPDTSGATAESHQYRAKALYNCECFCAWLRILQPRLTTPPDTASPDDPNEISFAKGEILDILDKNGKWWQAKKSDGTVGSESDSPSPLSSLLTIRL